MPLEFLTDAQVAGYGRFEGVPSRADLERFFVLDEVDKELIGDRRGEHNRLGLMLQATTVRYVGRFLEDPRAAGWSDGCGKVVGVTNLKVVAKHGEEAIGDAVASVGFTRAEDLEAEDQFAPLYFRAALPESYLGQGGMRINSLIQRTNMSGRAWVIMVSVAVFNADIEAVRDQVVSRGHSPATVTDTLRGLTERVLKLHDQREFSSLEGVEKGAQRIAAQLGDNFEWWYAHFATAESTYDYLARSDTRTPPRNYDTGLILALQNNNQARADTFVRCMFFHEGGVRSRFETYTNVASRYRRIGEVFGVQLSLPSWDELQNANI